MEQKKLLFAILMFASLAAAKPVVTFAYSPTCGHCERMMPLVQQTEAEFGDEIGVIYADVSTQEGKDLVSSLGGISGVPTVFLGTEKIITGERTDFKQILENKICEQIQQSPACANVEEKRNQAATAYLVATVAVLGLVAIHLKLKK